MSQIDWKREMDHLMDLFEHESTITLRKIIRCFETIGRPFDEKFRQYFMGRSNFRLESSFNTVLLETGYENPMKKASSSSVPNDGLDLGGEADNLHPIDDHTNSKSVLESNMQKDNDDAAIDIYDSNDEENVEVDVKRELKVEVEEEMVDLPMVVFDPRNENGSVEIENDAHASESMSGQGQANPSIIGQNKAARTNDMRFKCNDCSYTTDIKCNFKTHRLIHDGIKPFKCEQCDYAARQKAHLIGHQRIHADQKMMDIAQDPDDKSYKCTHCNQRFTKWNNLKQHLTRSHKNNQRLFNCKRCMRPFAQKTQKNLHETRCHKRRYECFLCKTYVTRELTNLRAHMQTHTGAKPFECAVCNTRFQTKSNLRYHLKSIHSRTST